MAIGLPFLLVFVLGGAQFGVLAYGNIQVDTAAHEASMTGTKQPAGSLTTPNSLAPGSYTCLPYLSSYTGIGDYELAEANPICVAAYEAAGSLDKTQMTVQIYAPSGSSGLSRRTPDVVTMAHAGPATVPMNNGNGGNGCNGTLAAVTGTITGQPNGVVVAVAAQGTGSSTNSDTSGNYTLCLAPATSAETLTATYADTVNNCTYSATTSYQPTKNDTFTWSPSLTKTCGSTNGCTNHNYALSGTIDLTGAPAGVSITITSGSGGSANVNMTTGAYLLCATPNNGQTSITASAGPDASGCNYSATTSVNAQQDGSGTWSPAFSSFTKTCGGCPASMYAVTGTATATGAPAGTTVTLSASSGGQTTALSGGAFTLCVTIPSPPTTTAILSASAQDAAGCTYSATTNVTPTAGGSTTWSPTLAQSCPVGGGGGGGTCTNNTPSNYFSVTVTYKVPIFVPFIGQLLSDNGNSSARTVKATVWAEAAPCTVTGGN